MGCQETRRTRACERRPGKKATAHTARRHEVAVSNDGKFVDVGDRNARSSHAGCRIIACSQREGKQTRAQKDSKGELQAER
jgi:hypothetical protein